MSIVIGEIDASVPWIHGYVFAAFVGSDMPSVLIYGRLPSLEYLRMI